MKRENHYGTTAIETIMHASEILSNVIVNVTDGDEHKATLVQYKNNEKFL